MEKNDVKRWKMKPDTENVRFADTDIFIYIFPYLYKLTYKSCHNGSQVAIAESE